MDQSPILSVRQGKLQGKVATDHSGGKYLCFLGIPYAKPPTGELRFKAPQPAESWNGIRDATKEGEMCYSQHMIFRNMIGSEDCLFLNVYTPELPSKSTALKPVMVWIHGGGFVEGSGSSDVYGPDFLLPHDVVFVSINYRLGLLGFLNFGDSSIGIPGNAGLKDQVMALKWVKDNISAFNGDPNNVTIFGESAGGASVHYLVLSPMAKGLFHKSIMQSGSATSVWAKGQRSTPLLAPVLNLEGATEQEIYKTVSSMSKEELYKLQIAVPDLFAPCRIRLIGPVVEKNTTEPAFLPQEPLDIISSGNYSQVPLIFGYCSREGMVGEIFSKLSGVEFKMEDDFKQHIPHTLKIKDPQIVEEVAKKIQAFYYGNDQPTLENIDQYHILTTDTIFLRYIHNSVVNHLSTSTQPIYLYRLTVDSNLNMFKKIGRLEKPGACHADDIGYLFKNALTPALRLGSVEYEAMNRITKLWTNFACHGDPNPKEKDPLINTTWKPTEKELLHFLDIGENLTVGTNPEYSRMKFWDDLCSYSASKL